MASRPGGVGRGGRGAALMQLLNQQVRAPGDTQAGGSQQSAGAFGTGSQPTGMMPGGPAPPVQVHLGPQAVLPQQATSHTAVPPSSVQPPPEPVAAMQGLAEPGHSAVRRGRGAMLQQLYDVQVAPQQQPAYLGSTPSDTSLDTG